MNRGDLAIKTSIIGIISRIVLITLNFVVRFMFIRFLGEELLGLEGVVKDTVSLLAMADLGVDVAMTYRLYSVVQRNPNKIEEYLYVYKNIYRVIMLVVIILGVVGSIFLKYIIKGLSLSWGYIYLIYFIQILAIEASYILAYKRCLLNAKQNKYIQLKVETVVGALAGVLKILVIIFFKSYVTYLIIAVLQNMLTNMILSSYSDKNYIVPNHGTLKGYNKYSNQILKDVMGDTKDVIGNKIVGFIYSSTDNIIISSFLGTTIVAYIANYKLIFAALNSLLIGSISSVTPIIGNYLNSGINVKKTFGLLHDYTFVRFCFAIMCVIPSFALGNMFISLYAGKDWILNNDILLLLCCDFYIGCIYGGTSDFSMSVGIFEKQMRVSVIGAIANILLSIIFVNLFGLKGVLIGTVTSQFVLWIGNWKIISKHAEYSKKEAFLYWRDNVYYFFALIVCVGISLGLVNVLPTSQFRWVEFVYKAIVVDSLVVVVIMFVYRKEKIMTLFINKLRGRICGKK